MLGIGDVARSGRERVRVFLRHLVEDRIVLERWYARRRAPLVDRLAQPRRDRAEVHLRELTHEQLVQVDDGDSVLRSVRHADAAFRRLRVHVVRAMDGAEREAFMGA